VKVAESEIALHSRARGFFRPLLAWTPSPYISISSFKIGVQVVSFLSMLLGIRELPPSIFGAFSAAWAIVTVCGAVLYNGFYQYVLRVPDIAAVAGTTLSMLVLEGAGLSAMLLVLSQLPQFGGAPLISYSLLSLLPIPLLMSFSSWNEALLVRRQKLRILSAIQFCCEVLGSLALIIGTRMGLELWALLLWRLTPAVCSAIALPFANRIFPGLRIDRAHARDALSTALPLQGTALLGAAAQYAGDIFLMGHLNTATSGAYRVANRISSTAGTMFIDPMRPITWAALAEAGREGNLPKMRRDFEEQLRLVALLAWPALLTIAVFNERLLAAFTRYDWSAAAPLLTLLAIARAPEVIASFAEPALICTGRVAASATYRTATIIVGVAGIALISPHGATAIAKWQCCYGLAVGAVYSEVAVRALGASRLRLARVLAPAVLTAACCVGAGELCYRLVPVSPFLRLIASMAATGVVAITSFGILYSRGLVSLPKLGNWAPRHPQSSSQK
jgi:O-antigen/teichoic acid export membrane protein